MSTFEEKLENFCQTELDPEVINQQFAAPFRLTGEFYALQKGLEIGARKTAAWAVQQPPHLPWNDTTKWILGMLCFQCGALAQGMRRLGHEIPQKAEAEQAYVIHWMLNLYLEHGENWRKVAAELLKEPSSETVEALPAGTGV